MAETKNCPNKDWFTRLLDGKLTPEQEARLSRHLDQCQRCQATLEQFNRSELLDSNAALNSESVSGSGIQLPEVVESKLAEIRAIRPSIEVAFNSGCADILPWLEDAETHIGRVAEFELVRFIGRGGMGVVFEANDTKLERAVALKLMSPALLADPKAAERFLREARAAAKISHANVVAVHSVDQIRGLPYLVMELVRGQSLGQQLATSPRISAIQILKIARQTSLGLAAAHKSGIIHRDIKPSNLMIDTQAKRVRIADFGLASTANESALTRSGMLVGTPDFASPEQVNGQPVDERSDLFSLGCVLYFLCTGKPPFASDSLMQTLDGIRNAEPNVAELKRNSVPRALIDIIQRLVNKEPGDRFQTADELCEALKQASVLRQSDKVSIIPTSTKRAKPRFVGYLAYGFLLAVIFAGGLIWWSQPRGNLDAFHTPIVEKTEQNQTEEDEKIERTRRIELENVPQDDDVPANKIARQVNSRDEFYEALEAPGDIWLKLVPGRIYEIDQPIEFNSQTIRIEGDANQPAVLSLKTGVEDPGIHADGVELILSGVKIEDSNNIESEEALIYCEGGKLTLDNCSLCSSHREFAIEIDQADLTLQSTIAVSHNTCFRLHPLMNQQVRIGDSVLLSHVNFRVEYPPQFDLIANGSCFVAWSGFEIQADQLDEISIGIEVEDCEFRYPDAMLLFMDEESDFDKSEIAEGVASRFYFEGTDAIVPFNLLGLLNGGDEEYILWNETDVPLNGQTRQKNFAEEKSIEWIDQACSDSETDLVEQVRKLLD